jgi:hypothetical protein
VGYGGVFICKKDNNKQTEKNHLINRWFSVVGDNGLEPVKQRTPFEGAKRRAKGSESLMRGTTAI